MKKNNVKSIGLEELLKQVSPKFERFMLWQKVKTWLVIILPILLIASVSYNVYQSVHFKNENNALINRAVTIYTKDIAKEKEIGDKLQEAYNALVNKYNAMSDQCEVDSKNAAQWNSLFNKTRQYGNRHCYYIEANDMINCSSY